jgi:ABC-2 type transport system ATP-binding protein
MPPIIEVEQLVKRYRKATVNAVDGVSFCVEQGQLFTFLGPNGAGKTTTISILTTTLSPTSGRVRIAGHDVVQEASAVRQRVGIIFQQPSLDLNLTAEENVRFHAVLYGLYPFRPAFRLMPREYRRQIEKLAHVLGIEGEMGKPVKTFSGGMKRKLEIIRSLIHQPTVLFLDEPTLGLDPASRRNLWEYLRGVRNQSGTTLFLTTHYLEEAEEADIVCIINRGKIVSHGTPEQVKSELVQHYLLLDAGGSEDRDTLRAELQRLNVPFTETPQFKIKLDGNGLGQGIDAQHIIKAIDTPLTVLQTHMPTLEDAYLAIVGREESHGEEKVEEQAQVGSEG